MPRKRSSNNGNSNRPSPVKDFKLEFKNASQKLAYSAFDQHDVLFMLGPAGTGKTFLATAFAIGEIIAKNKSRLIISRPIVEAGESLGYLPGPQPLDAKILTPNGWSVMGEIKKGSFVVDSNGSPSKVIEVFPKGKKSVFKIFTNEGTCTECCEDHLWFTRTLEDRKRGRDGSVKSTKEIMKTLYVNGKLNHSIPRNKPVNFNKRDLPIAPYVMGAILGNGCVSEEVSLASKDLDLIERVNNELKDCRLIKKGNSINYNFKSNCISSNKPARKVCIELKNGEKREYESLHVASNAEKISRNVLKYRCANKVTFDGAKYSFLPLENRWSISIKNHLDNLGLLGKKSFDKFIPEDYKYSSLEDRINLLRGLMDTDGAVKNNGEASFCTTSRRLALDVIDLVRSLGGCAILRCRGKRDSVKSKHDIYEFNISLPNDLNPFFIKRKYDKFNCSYTQSIKIKSIEMIEEKEVQCILIDSEDHLYLTDDYLVTHNTFQEKVDPYMMPIFDCITKLVGKDTPNREKLDKVLEIAPLAYLRGRSFGNSICILDEAQNCTFQQLKLLLTRFEDNTKVIITGDPNQSDLPGNNALMDVVRRLETVPGIGVIKFPHDAIVRHPLVGKIIEKLEGD